jgi:hypothetical protein
VPTLPLLEVAVVHVVVRLARLVHGVQRDELARPARRSDPPTRTPIGRRRNEATSLVHAYRAGQWASCEAARNPTSAWNVTSMFTRSRSALGISLCTPTVSTCVRAGRGGGDRDARGERVSACVMVGGALVLQARRTLAPRERNSGHRERQTVERGGTSNHPPLPSSSLDAP